MVVTSSGSSSNKGGYLNLALGPALQCAEAASLGMPFEVWKTRMGRQRQETTIEAFRNVYRSGGVGAFWAGTGPKMIESASKGAVLLYSKEAILKTLQKSGLDATTSGVLAGAGGGVCQTVVMGPCTFLVTAAVNGDKSVSTTQFIKTTYAAKGVSGFYPGGAAIAFRQATNWASRQGFTEFAREKVKMAKYGSKDAKLTKLDEVTSGIIGGTLSAWNHPFEVVRIEQQTRASRGETAITMVGVLRLVVKEQGVAGLFSGVIPRIGLGIWQTLFMVTGAKVVTEELKKAGMI